MPKQFNENFSNEKFFTTKDELVKSLEINWQYLLKNELQNENFTKIIQNLNTAKTPIFPPKKLIFNALNLTPFENIKAVILGQDPYHKPNQAMGLSFSVPNGVKIPPSLANIFKELQNDLGIDTSAFSGDLTPWAKNGVLLLNSSLSVSQNAPNSHANFGWQNFSDAIISTISKRKNNVVFMLWGNFAKTKSSLIDSSKHLILQSAHPSPLARGAFFGCKHFSKCNEYLQKNGIQPVKWDLNALDI